VSSTTTRPVLACRLASAFAVAVAVVVVPLQWLGPAMAAPAGSMSSSPPRAAGYFKTRPVGTWSSLPSGRTCRHQVRESAWEPRPDNAGPNSQMPNTRRVHAALAARPRSTDGSYARKWDRWLLRRVTGHYTGTTDEIMQWAACKWGISDNVLRAVAVRESTWYQYEVYPSGRCVYLWGCGDLMPDSSSASLTYCTAISRRGHDYQADYGDGICPKTFSIVGIMSWQDPGWGQMKDDQNGTFPFSRNSTAFAMDYLAAELRGCYEGWERWLADAGTAGYSPGDLWGCVGAWYAGDWRSDSALGYIHRVRTELRDRTWLERGWRRVRPDCSPMYGCPQGS
jgi:hypothetical protein